ncbi:lytic murein transglycosylase [Streptomyces sp. NBC_01754]|uniref:lytic transglycosylase domain-containing protein n=1 Tax=Streptomyces sp. NBC_01754 TaxID=2975930 RepID=UPI002DD7D489|nr:lytic murein transglycosylase [Streptomyces sp. NBC_01754]WSC96061.1 lytic murein transglycosylase [Streptomyces sp. NBC_01754]
MRFNDSVRRGLGGTAAAFAAMAALTASQAPGLTGAGTGADMKNVAADDVVWTEVPNDDSYHTELPPLITPEPPKATPATKSGPARAAARTWAEAGIPATVLAAYRSAETSLARTDPGCHLPWQLLAAIGKVESGHASGGRVDARGTTLTPILGPVLDGVGFAHIPDTDAGRYDGDAVYDRAVGPMQFIPSTWAHWGADGNGDGRKDPGNIHDAALAAGRYLCAGPRDLSVRADLDRAILSYNHSDTYLRTVLSWLEFYRKGTHPVADGTGVVPGSPGAGGPHAPKAPVGGPGSPSAPGKGGGIVIGPPPGGTPSPSTSPTPSPSGTPDPGDSATPTDPGPSPDPTDGGSPDPSTTPDPDPTTTPDPGATDPATPGPTTAPDPDPGTTDPGCPGPTGTPDPNAPSEGPCATPPTD